MARTLRAPLVGLALAAAMLMAMALPVAAQPVDQEGLINLNLGDVTVQVPVAVAANICDVAVNVVAQSARTGETTCDALAESEARNQARGQGPVNQEGLINLNVGDVTAQVPVAVAANICDLAVNVVARADRTGETTCEALAESSAANTRNNG